MSGEGEAMIRREVAHDRAWVLVLFLVALMLGAMLVPRVSGAE